VDLAGVVLAEAEVGSAEVAGFAGCSPHPVMAAALTVVRLQRLAREVALTAAQIRGRLTAIAVPMATQLVAQVRVDRVVEETRVGQDLARPRAKRGALPMLMVNGTHLGSDRVAQVRVQGFQAVSTRAAIPPTLLSRAVLVREVGRDWLMR
jgi:hypothetical protein